MMLTINDKIKELWNEAKDKERYCNNARSYDSGGHIVITECPIEIEGMDCLAVLDDEDALTIYLNRCYKNEESPYFDENVVRYYSAGENLAKAVAELVKKLSEI